MLDMHVQTYQKLEKNPDSVTIGQAKEIAEYLDIVQNAESVTKHFKHGVRGRDDSREKKSPCAGRGEPQSIE